MESSGTLQHVVGPHSHFIPLVRQLPLQSVPSFKGPQSSVAESVCSLLADVAYVASRRSGVLLVIVDVERLLLLDFSRVTLKNAFVSVFMLALLPHEPGCK